MFLNNLYTLFDFLVDQNQVYKVETIGDAYLIVSGCPTKATNHALKICDMAFDMMDGIQMLKDPGTGKEVLMRIGCHSGPVVAGIVGLKMPRYNKPWYRNGRVNHKYFVKWGRVCLLLVLKVMIKLRRALSPPLECLSFCLL